MHFRSTKFHKKWSLLFLVLAMLMLLPTPGQAEIKVLTLRHVSAEKILPMLRELLDGRGKVCQWENRLIVNAGPDEIATVEEVLRQIDKAPSMVRVTVRTENRHAQAGNRIGVAVMQSTDSSSTSTGFSTGSRMGNAVENEEYFLRVRDGGQGFILMGKEVPFVREMLVLAKRYAGYGQTIDFQEVNTGFWVRPVLEGDYASLDIRPHLEGYKKNGAGMAGLPATIELQSLVTTVRVPLGKWVDLGGFLRDGDEISRSIVAWRAGNSREEKTIWLKVDR